MERKPYYDSDELPDDLSDLFVPWDEWAWQSLKDRYPETAVKLARLVIAGTGPRVIRRYALEHGYFTNVAGWLEQCALHAQRSLAANDGRDVLSLAEE